MELLTGTHFRGQAHNTACVVVFTYCTHAWLAGMGIWLFLDNIDSLSYWCKMKTQFQLLKFRKYCSVHEAVPYLFDVFWFCSGFLYIPPKVCHRLCLLHPESSPREICHPRLFHIHWGNTEAICEMQAAFICEGLDQFFILIKETSQ